MSKDFKLNIAKVESLGFLIEYQFKNLDFVDILKKEIKNSVGSMDYKTNVKGKMTNFSKFTKNKIFNNLLEECIEITHVLNLPKSILTDAWGNILKKGDSVEVHSHYKCSISGVLYLTEDGPGTYFPQFNKTIDEKIGKVLLFSGNLLHGVPIYNGNEDRYTIAFNFEEMTPWNDIK
jgi:hypothetical protein